jgi:hypothetical protein
MKAIAARAPSPKGQVRVAVDRIVRFPEGFDYGSGYSHLGFHDAAGTQFAVVHDHHWVGAFDAPDSFAWTAGRFRPRESRLHIPADLSYPMYVSRAADGSFLVSSFGNGWVHRISPDERRADVLIDGARRGLRDVGNCVVDAEGYIWINEVTGCRIWRFDPSGKPVLTIGSGELGFERGRVLLAKAHFSWVYDIRIGPDARLYVLDGKNFAVRSIDLVEDVVETLVGTGRPGYSGDGGDARDATLGGDPSQRFDGPLSLSLDERGDIFIGDTRNHVVRMVEHDTNVISTVAGDPAAQRGQHSDPDEKDPFALKLFEICSMDYFDGRLYVPEMSGDLVLLAL